MAALSWLVTARGLQPRARQINWFSKMNALSFIAFSLVAMPVLGAAVHFPHAASSTSPDGKWNVTCTNPAKNANDLRHILILTGPEGRSVELRRIDRDCTVVWSPDSSRFAITDNYASDRSDIFFYSNAGRVSKKSVWEQFPTNTIPQEELAGHCYFEACEWLDRHRLRIKISGHTDYPPPVYGFEHEYIFDFTSGKFEKAGKGKSDKSLHPRAATPSR